MRVERKRMIVGRGFTGAFGRSSATMIVIATMMVVEIDRVRMPRIRTGGFCRSVVSLAGSDMHPTCGLPQKDQSTQEVGNRAANRRDHRI